MAILIQHKRKWLTQYDRNSMKSAGFDFNKFSKVSNIFFGQARIREEIGEYIPSPGKYHFQGPIVLGERYSHLPT